MHVTVDQPRQHEAVTQIDNTRAGWTTLATIEHRTDAPVLDDDAGHAPRCLARFREYAIRLHHNDSAGCSGRGLCTRRRSKDAQHCDKVCEDNSEAEAERGAEH